MHCEYPEHIMKSEQEKQNSHTILHWYQHALFYKSETINQRDEPRQEVLTDGTGTPGH